MNLENFTLKIPELKKISKCLTNEGIEAWLQLNKIPFQIGIGGEPIVLRHQFDIHFNQENNQHPFELNGGVIFDRRCCGIYFLKKLDEIIYIGKTTTLFVRMAAHDKGEADWDEVVFYPTEIRHLAALEKEMIAKYNPPLNKKLKIKNFSAKQVFE